jgi:two-component system, cell cycle response regulator
MAKNSIRASSAAALNVTGDVLVSDVQCVGSGAVCRYRDELLNLRQQVVTDPLTGLYNLRYLLRALEQEFERTGVSTGLLMIDIDHFKQVNDQFGHEAGNTVLQQAARLIQQATRRLDIQCRYGGEEFAVILPSSSLMACAAAAERVRLAVESAFWRIDERQLSVTVSVGVAAVLNTRGCHPKELILLADEQLYAAKESGRNRVCVASVKRPDSRVTADEKDMMRSLFAPDR